MAPFLPVRAISRSQRVRIGGVEVKQNVTTYVDMNPEAKSKPAAYSPVKELRNHLTLGAIVVVGPLTNSASDWIVVRGGLVTIEKQAENTETELKYETGELQQRSTGKYQEIEATKEKQKVKEPGATKERIDIVTVKNSNGKFKLTEGVEAAQNKAVAPEVAAGETILASLKSYNKNKTVAVVTDERPRS